MPVTGLSAESQLTRLLTKCQNTKASQLQMPGDCNYNINPSMACPCIMPACLWTVEDQSLIDVKTRTRWKTPIRHIYTINTVAKLMELIDQ